MKKLLTVIASLITLAFTLALVAIIYVVNLDPNNHKDWITEKFNEKTGRSLTLGGDISLTLYPWLGLELNQLTVSNAPGFGDEPLFHTDHAEVRIKLLPMLNRRYEIDSVLLTGTRINLAVNEAGQSNWEDLFGRSGTSGTEDSSPAALSLSNVVLGGVDIQNASLTLDNRSADLHYEITNLTMTTGELVYGQPVQFDLSLNAAASRPELEALINLSGTVTYDPGNQQYDLSPLALTSTISGPNVPEGSADIILETTLSISLEEDTLFLRDLEFDAFGSHLSADVSVRNLQTGSPAFQAEVELVGNDLALLFQIAEIEELATQIAGLDSREFDFSASLNVDMQRGNITLSTLEARLLGANIVGNVAASNILSDTPVINGSLSASGPDLPTLIEVVGQIQGGNDSALSQYGRELSRVPDKAFSIDTDFNADLQRGDITVSTLVARLFGASITGDFVASEIQSDTPLISGSLHASGPDLPLMFQIVGQLQGGVESSLNQYGIQLRSVSNKAFTINVDFDVDLGNGNIEVPVLAAEALGFTLNGRLTTQNMRNNNGTVNGELTLTGDNLRAVLAAMGQAELAEVVQSMNLDIQLSGDRSDLNISPLDLSLVISGPQIPNSPVSLVLNADTHLNLDRETLSINSFTLNGLGLHLNGNVNASKLFDAADYSGQLNIPAFNLRRLMQQLNQELPETADNSVFQTMSLGASFSGSANNVNLSNITMTLDDSSLKGSFSLTDFENPAIEFDIDIDQLNADRYLAPESAASTVDSEASELPIETLQALNVKGNLNIKQLTISNMNLSDFVVGVNAYNGRLELSPVQANLYQGTYSGSFSLDSSNGVPVVNFDSSLKNVTLEPLLIDFMDASYVSGTANIELSLSGSGVNTRAIKSSLNGSGSIKLLDGVLSGVDVGSVLVQVETMLRNQRLMEIQRGEETPFNNFSGTIAISNGIVSSNDLLIEAPGFQVTGRGTLLNLNNDTINYELLTSVDQTTATNETEEYDIGGYDLPISCTGTISSPSCLPDVGEIIKVALANVVQRGISDLLQRSFGIEETQGDVQDLESGEDTQEEETQPLDPAQELLNRAIERLFR